MKAALTKIIIAVSLFVTPAAAQDQPGQPTGQTQGQNPSRQPGGEYTIQLNQNQNREQKQETPDPTKQGRNQQPSPPPRPGEIQGREVIVPGYNPTEQLQNARPELSPEQRLDVVQRMLQRKLGGDAVQQFNARARQIGTKVSEPGQGAPSADTLFDNAAKRFGDEPEEKRRELKPQGNSFFGLGGSQKTSPSYNGSGGQISRAAAEQTVRTMKSVPGGVVIEGKASDLGWVKNVKYEPLLNAFVLDDRAVYLSPIPSHSAALIAQAIAEDERIGVSIAPLLLVYGKLPKESDVAMDLMLADRFLAWFVYPGRGVEEYEVANGIEPLPAPYRKATVLFTFKDFQFAINEEELRLIGASFDARIVPLAANRAADGGNLPDLDAISAGQFSDDVANAILNAKQVGDNFNYYRRENIIERTLAYGEVAALFRALKDAQIDLRELARRVDAAGRSPSVYGEVGRTTEGESGSQRTEASWVVYLKSIQARNQFVNWSGPPYDIYQCGSGNKETRISACTQIIDHSGGKSQKYLALAHRYRAANYLDESEYDLAITDYGKAIQLNPKYAVAYMGRGVAYLRKEDVDRAIADYSEAIKINPKNEEAYARRGQALSSKKDYDHAVADLNEAIKLSPQYAWAYNQRGVIWSEKNDIDRAIADYSEAIKINPKFEEAFARRGQAWSTKKDHDRAITDLNEAIKLYPQYGWAYSERGNAYYDSKRYDLAIADYNEVIKLDPKVDDAYNNRGMAWERMGNKQRAMEDYRQALINNPAWDAPKQNLARLGAGSGPPDVNNNTQVAPQRELANVPESQKISWCENENARFSADLVIQGCTALIQSGKETRANLTTDYINRAIAYGGSHDNDRAIADYNRALEIDPKNAVAYYNRGALYIDKDDYDRAIVDFDEAIRFDPKYADAYFNRGLAHYSKRDFDSAISDYSKAIRFDPKKADAYVNRGLAYIDKEDYDRAIVDFDEAIRFDPKNADAYFNRGVAYYHKEDYDRAISDYSKAINFDPKKADAYSNRGLAYDDKGDIDRAIADYSEAIRLNPRDADAFNSRGLDYENKGDLDQAIADYSEAIKIDAKHARAYFNRGEAYKAKGDLDRANSDHNEAIKLDPDLKNLDERG